jgi:thiol-disulfide isomerase/thioredoxin
MDRDTPAAAPLTAAVLGAPLGARATLVHFSSAFCLPCRATRRVLAEVAELVPGVAHIEVDAESRLGLVRDLAVLSTPTVLVLDADGREVRRAQGRPGKAAVIAALGKAVAGPPD